MNDFLVGIVLNILKNFLNKDLVTKYEAELIALLQAEIAQAPALIKQGEQAAVCWLAELAKKTDNKVDDALVAIVADAVGVDASACGK